MIVFVPPPPLACDLSLIMAPSPSAWSSSAKRRLRTRVVAARWAQWHGLQCLGTVLCADKMGIKERSEAKLDDGTVSQADIDELRAFWGKHRQEAKTMELSEVAAVSFQDVSPFAWNVQAPAFFPAFLGYYFEARGGQIEDEEENRNSKAKKRKVEEDVDVEYVSIKGQSNKAGERGWSSLPLFTRLDRCALSVVSRRHKKLVEELDDPFLYGEAAGSISDAYSDDEQAENSSDEEYGCDEQEKWERAINNTPEEIARRLAQQGRAYGTSPLTSMVKHT